MIDSLEVARNAAARHAWREAHTAYSGADGAELEPQDLESFGEAAWWTGRLDEAIGLRERAHSAYTAAGDKRAAAQIGRAHV